MDKIGVSGLKINSALHWNSTKLFKNSASSVLNVNSV